MTQEVYSVSQINGYIKNIFSYDRILRYVSICGEVSNCRYHTSGHIYFTLKDEGGQLACVMFAGKRAGLSFVLKEGQSVVVSGQISVYERDGKYQMYADRIEQKGGKGLLYERFLKLKEKLSLEGLFDDGHKRRLPQYINTLGVVTAATGAALQDIINITRRRNPYVQIILSPATVQGENAPHSIISAINKLVAYSPDVIIVGRGGGSFEDLFCFNDEELARTIYDCPIPVISAVGHETDFTICDFVSDMRAPTPSAAAELAVYKLSDVLEKLAGISRTLGTFMHQRLANYRSLTERYHERVIARGPAATLNGRRVHLDAISDKLSSIMNSRMTAAKNRLLVDIERVKRGSPLDKLERGYSYITDEKGHNLKSTQDYVKGQRIDIEVIDGHISAECIDVCSSSDYRG